ncbi:LysR family transcriptional regulator [Millisia brevis]|uniref:LysR family transcriptional regulator n=1 Tax=Millisia brevis TaxID=264148 RepID=UPI0008334ECB|nr:LysR family transcriptional regulator [Millisia brevis]
MIDAVELRALLALEDHGTVAAASGALGYTPSAVSQQIKRLEQKVGRELIHPVGRNVTLTAAGRALAEQGRDLLTRWSDLEHAAGRFDDVPHGAVSIGAFPTALRGLVIPALRSLASSAPDLRVHLRELEIQTAIDAVLAGRLDACIAHGWRGLATPVPDDLRSDLLLGDRADIVVAADHPRADSVTAVPSDFLDATWAVQPVGTVCHAWFLHMFAGLGRVPRRVWEVGEYDTQVRLVDELGAVALLPRLGVTLDPARLHRIPVHDPVPIRDVHLIARPGFHGTPAHAALLGTLLATATGHGDRHNGRPPHPSV